jgi:hypothetical protein
MLKGIGPRRARTSRPFGAKVFSVSTSRCAPNGERTRGCFRSWGLSEEPLDVERSAIWTATGGCLCYSYESRNERSLFP